jgi:hypothetical protein
MSAPQFMAHAQTGDSPSGALSQSCLKTCQPAQIGQKTKYGRLIS